jgi:hypothetical protein
MDNTPDLGSIISTLSSNPALLGMISELMKSSTQTRQAEPAPPPPPLIQNVSASAEKAVNHGDSGINPELISTIFSMLGQGNQGEQQPKISAPKENHEPTDRASKSNDNALSRLLGSSTESENRLRLLNALRPYLSDERREKLDLILKLLRLAELGHLSGLLKSV